MPNCDRASCEVVAQWFSSDNVRFAVCKLDLGASTQHVRRKDQEESLEA